MPYGDIGVINTSPKKCQEVLFFVLFLFVLFLGFRQKATWEKGFETKSENL
jgi:hypothetical protein